jgi:hypothetical protein
MKFTGLFVVLILGIACLFPSHKKAIRWRTRLLIDRNHCRIVNVKDRIPVKKI